MFKTLNHQFNSVFGGPCANSIAADRYADECGKEEARVEARRQISNEIAKKALVGNYSDISLDTIQEAEADNDKFWQLTAQIREAVCSGKSDDDVMSLVRDLVVEQKFIIGNIASLKVTIKYLEAS